MKRSPSYVQIYVSITSRPIILIVEDANSDIAELTYYESSIRESREVVLTTENMKFTTIIGALLIGTSVVAATALPSDDANAPPSNSAASFTACENGASYCGWYMIDSLGK